MSSSTEQKHEAEEKHHFEDLSSMSNSRHESRLERRPQTNYFCNVFADDFFNKIGCLNLENILSVEQRINLLLFQNLLQHFEYRIAFKKIQYIFKLLDDNFIQAVIFFISFYIFILKTQTAIK